MFGFSVEDLCGVDKVMSELSRKKTIGFIDLERCLHFSIETFSVLFL